MKKAAFIIVTLFFIVSNPILAQSKKELKKQKEQKEYTKIKKLIQGGIYTFEAISANTQKGRRIDLTTNSNFLKINNPHTIADLPFFGFSQVSSFKGDGGIKFDSENVDYKIEYNDKKHRITIKFKAKNKAEAFDLFLTVYSDATATLNISSSHRDFMSYRGNIKETPLEK
ncbi:MAG: DUF4251 domain-containing protein [Flavobacteriaceae bacterium]